MAIDLQALLDPAHTAVVTSEIQNGILGPQAIFPALAEQARAQRLVDHIVELVNGARAAGVVVIHGLAHRRADGLGDNTNARLFAAAAKSGFAMEPGSELADVVSEVGVRDGELALGRLHGLNPYAGTDLDPLLRNLGITTVVVVGVSVNVAVTNLVMDLVNGGYQVVLPRDAVAGIPADYADSLIDNTLSLLATVTTVADVVGHWRAGG